MNEEEISEKIDHIENLVIVKKDIIDNIPRYFLCGSLNYLKYVFYNKLGSYEV